MDFGPALDDPVSVNFENYLPSGVTCLTEAVSLRGLCESETVLNRNHQSSGSSPFGQLCEKMCVLVQSHNLASDAHRTCSIRHG